MLGLKTAFYLDGVSFVHKTNLPDQDGRIWRKRCKGTSFGCTAKGQKEGTGGRLVKLFVAISHRKGVIQCTQYNHLDGKYFANFVRENLNGMFRLGERGKESPKFGFKMEIRVQR